MDEHTIFSIGSTTNAFTTTALAMLVDEGKLTWDDRVVDVLPGFQLHDPYVTRELTVRDLVTHRIGTLEHWHYDTFRVSWRAPARGRGLMTFRLDASARPAEVEVQGLGRFESTAEAPARGRGGPSPGGGPGHP